MLCSSGHTDTDNENQVKSFFWHISKAWLLSLYIFSCLFWSPKVLNELKSDNQRLKDENGALIRVISKLSKWAEWPTNNDCSETIFNSIPVVLSPTSFLMTPDHSFIGNSSLFMTSDVKKRREDLQKMEPSSNHTLDLKAVEIKAHPA